MEKHNVAAAWKHNNFVHLKLYHEKYNYVAGERFT